MTKQVTRRRVDRAARTATTTAIAQGEMMRAAGDVVVARLQILAAGMADPAQADLKEISLMGLEKIEAGALAAAGAAGQIGAASSGLGAAALRETALAQSAWLRALSAPGPMEASLALTDYGLGWWGRAATEAVRLNAALLEVQAEGLKPIHRAAMANAKRLKT